MGCERGLLWDAFVGRGSIAIGELAILVMVARLNRGIYTAHFGSTYVFILCISNLSCLMSIQLVAIWGF